MAVDVFGTFFTGVLLGLLLQIDTGVLKPRNN
jgi:hypothetical protein